MSIKTKIANFCWRIFGTKKVLKEQALLKQQMIQLQQQNQEVLLASKFHDTIIDSEWLKFKSFSPGGWAVDYCFLYTLYRTLDSMHPQNILEFGLGQSSKMVHQYANYYQANAITYEHDPEWIKFFSSDVKDKYPVHIFQSELEKINYKVFQTLTYKNIKESLGDNLYDLVVVDGPFGSPHYSRSQLLEIAENHLSDNFCILLDDYERMGEQETIQEVFNILNTKSVAYCSNVYSTSKQHIVICSMNNKFLTSL